MPTPDTFLLAQAQALRTKPPVRSPREEKMKQIWGDLDQGVADSLQGLQDLVTHPLDSLREMGSSLKQVATHPIQTAKALRQQLSDPRQATRMVGSMLTPDPLSLVKALRAPSKIGAPPTSNIIVPETLALPDESLELALAKRGSPPHETGWFKGEDGLFRKELEPVRWDDSKALKDIDGFVEWDHPDLATRLGTAKDELSIRRLEGYGKEKGAKGSIASYNPMDDEINLHDEMWPEIPEKHRHEILTHELQHYIQEAGGMGRGFKGSSPGQGVSMRRYLLDRGEVEARAAAARDHLLDPRYRELVPFDWNTRKMIERLQHGMNKPKMEGSPEFLEDMEAWLTLAEPLNR